VQVLLSVNENQVSLSFVDNGIGISHDVLPKLCQPFVQAENSISRSYEGAGLGLSLVAGFVELHGGKIDITSEISKGTCVTISLPRHYQAETSQGETEAQSNQLQSNDIEHAIVEGHAMGSAGNAA